MPRLCSHISNYISLILDLSAWASDLYLLNTVLNRTKNIAFKFFQRRQQPLSFIRLGIDQTLWWNIKSFLPWYWMWLAWFYIKTCGKRVAVQFLPRSWLIQQHWFMLPFYVLCFWRELPFYFRPNRPGLQTIPNCDLHSNLNPETVISSCAEIA